MYYLGFILSTKDTALVGQLSIIAMHDQIIMITITLALLLTIEIHRQISETARC